MGKKRRRGDRHDPLLFTFRVDHPDFVGIDLFVSPYALCNCDPSVLHKQTVRRAAGFRQRHGNAILYSLRARNNRASPGFFKGISRFVAKKGQ